MELKRGIDITLGCTILAEMKDIQILQVSGRVGHASFPGRLTVCDKVNHNFNGGAGRNRRLKTWIIRSHGIKKGQIMSLE